jgi:sec-independent protein translocase protein TatB
MFPEGRMLDFVIVGVIALIVVGPKDLPILMRKVGQFVAKMRGMANEFRASFDELARQSELEELRKEVEAMRHGQQSVLSQFNPLSDPHAKTVFDDIGQHMDTPITSAPVMTALPQAEPVVAEPVVAEPAPFAPVAAKPARAPRTQAVAKPAPTAKAKPAPAAKTTKTTATKTPAPRAAVKPKAATPKTAKPAAAKTRAKAASTSGNAS